MDITAIDFRETVARGDVLEAEVQLERPSQRLTAMLPPGEGGRAEAILGARRWDAKHYWQLEPGVMQYEFDEPLPAGPVVIRVPFTRR